MRKVKTIAMEAKTYLDPREYLRDCWRLARKVYDSGWRPDVLLVLWRGGAAPGVEVAGPQVHGVGAGLDSGTEGLRRARRGEQLQHYFFLLDRLKTSIFRSAISRFSLARSSRASFSWRWRFREASFSRK